MTHGDTIRLYREVEERLRVVGLGVLLNEDTGNFIITDNGDMVKNMEFTTVDQLLGFVDGVYYILNKALQKKEKGDDGAGPDDKNRGEPAKSGRRNKVNP